MGLRRKSRELALQLLFSLDMQGEMASFSEEQEQKIAHCCEQFDVSPQALPYAKLLAQGVCQHLGTIDPLLAEYSQHWRVERMSIVDRNILRIAAYELERALDVPAQVVINEALEIAKRYSIGDSVSFINGILDAMQKKLRS